MTQQDRDFPFAHRLQADMPTEIRGTAERGADGPPRHRIAALAVALAVVSGLTAVAVPAGDAQAMRVQDCGPGWISRRRRPRLGRRLPLLIAVRPTRRSRKDGRP